MKKSYTNLIFIVSALVALFSIFAFIFFFKIIKNKNEHTSKVLITLSEKMADKQNAKTLIGRFAELESTQKKINNYFIDPSKIDTFVDYLEKLGVNNNTELIVKNVEILNKEKDTIAVKVSIIGDFTNVVKVIYLLENSPYHISLTQAFVNETIKIVEEEIKGVKKETQIASWQADVSFNILSLPQK